MIKCVIIDDDELSRSLIREFMKKDPDLSVIQEFSNPAEAIEFVKKTPIDLLFLDIEMPHMTGIEFVELMDKDLPPTILTTSHSDFAINAFQFNVSGYLVKPYNYAQFYKAVEKIKLAKQAPKPTPTNTYLFVKSGAGLVKLNINDISLIECIGDYVNLYAGEEKYTIHSTMKAMEEKIAGNDFIRVHRSYIIKIDKIEEIEDDAISFGKKNIPIGRTYRSEVFAKLNII